MNITKIVFWLTIAIWSVLVFIVSDRANGATYGPYRAELIGVVDADTMDFKVFIWPNQIANIRVRLSAVDTPEKRGSPECEKELAKKATTFVTNMLSEADVIYVATTGLGSFSRYIAGVTVDGKSLSNLLLEIGYARPYIKGNKAGWC